MSFDEVCASAKGAFNVYMVDGSWISLTLITATLIYQLLTQVSKESRGNQSLSTTQVTVIFRVVMLIDSSLGFMLI